MLIIAFINPVMSTPAAGQGSIKFGLHPIPCSPLSDPSTSRPQDKRLIDNHDLGSQRERSHREEPHRTPVPA